MTGIAGAATPRNLTAEKRELFLADLTQRGITLEQADFAGIEFTPNARLDVAPELRPAAALRIPYFDIDGQPVPVERDGEWYQHERVRYLEEGALSFTGKKPPKYQQPARTSNHAYFPRVEGLDWRAVLADPSIPLIATEGEAKALVGSLANFCVVGLGGIWNFLRDGELLPELQALALGRHWFIAHDFDAKPRTRRNVALAARRLALKLVEHGAIPHIVTLPELAGGGKTALDTFLQSPDGGPQALEQLLNNTSPVDLNAVTIQAGTDIELADAVLGHLQDTHGSAIVFCDGKFHAFNGTHWVALPDNQLATTVYRFDKTPFGQSGLVKLTDARTKSILAILRNKVAEPDFFSDAPNGINAGNGFVTFDAEGVPSLEPHDREHRQRHCLPGHYDPAAQWRDAPLLTQFLSGCFPDEPDYEQRVQLLSECFGIAALGIATRLRAPKALILYGPTANNGKSQALGMLRGLLPASAVTSIPLAKLSDQYALIKLAGCQLNAVAELGTSDAIASDVFKSVVTGDQVMARDLHQSQVFFSPTALHVYACNALPAFRGGFDPGVQRRLRVITFNRSIPRDEQIADIGARIASEEPDALLAFAIEGASHVLRSGALTEPASSRETLSEWVSGADPVLAWKDARTEVAIGDEVPTKALYADFREWAEAEGVRADRLPTPNNFVQRVRAQEGRIGIRRNRAQRFVTNIRLLPRENVWPMHR